VLPIRPVLLLSALLCAASASCASAPRQPAADPSQPKAANAICMTLVDYKSGARMELVNASHTDPVEQYSTVRNNAARKVQTDDLMDGLWGYLKEQGFERDSRAGRAPDKAVGSLRWSLQVQSPEGIAYVAEPEDASASARQHLRIFSKAFIDTYNATQGWQAVKVRDGESPFQGPNLKPSVKKGNKN
jgi:hypothetical protein